MCTDQITHMRNYIGEQSECGRSLPALSTEIVVAECTKYKKAPPPNALSTKIPFSLGALSTKTVFAERAKYKKTFSPNALSTKTGTAECAKGILARDRANDNNQCPNC